MRRFSGMIFLVVVMAAACSCGSGGDEKKVDCGNDEDCAACLLDQLPYWCYADRAEAKKDTAMCGNITQYWGEEVGNVADQCLSRIAELTKDCSLCEEIANDSIRNQCRQDCQ